MRWRDEEESAESSSEDPKQLLIGIYLRSNKKGIGEEKEEGSREDPEQILPSTSLNNNRKGGGSLQRGS